MKTFLIDAEKCIDCRNCQTACKDEFCDNDWSPLAALQGPRQYWIHILNHEAGDGERVRMERIPLVCQQCADAPCMKAAQDGAAYRREDGIVIFDPGEGEGPARHHGCLARTGPCTGTRSSTFRKSALCAPI